MLYTAVHLLTFQKELLLTKRGLITLSPGTAGHDTLGAALCLGESWIGAAVVMSRCTATILHSAQVGVVLGGTAVVVRHHAILCDMTHWYVGLTCGTWPDSGVGPASFTRVKLLLTCVTWLVSHDLSLHSIQYVYIYIYIYYIYMHLFTCVTRLVVAQHNTRLYDSFICGIHIWYILSLTCVTWLVHMCDMTCSNVWHDLSLHSITLVCTTHSHLWFTHGTWLHWHVWHDLFTCVTHLLLHNITQSKREVWDFLNYDAVCQDIMPWRRLSYRRAKHCNMRATHCNMRASWLSAVLLSWYGITPFTCHTHKCVMAHT